jgi:transcriptional regulator with XRE-family HTH domain
MFRQIATFVPASQLFQKHPAELALVLEEVWNRRFALNAPPGHPDNRSPLDGLPPWMPFPKPDPLPPGVPIPGSGGERFSPFRWDHLIYAYMVENTRVLEVMRRVVHEMAHGEKLGTPTAEAQAWLRSTEELFFKDGAPFLVTSLASPLRPDARATRRNAYQRMFGMELNHGLDDGQPLAYVKADAANREFVATFEEFLREVWIGMIFVNATSTANPTDDAKIATLAEKLSDMLRSRRQNGNLAREEFAAVSALSWFHLTLEFESPIVKALRAESTGLEQTLFKIAERVGLPAHGLAKHFFEIADPISRLLIQIETGIYNGAAAVPALYTRVNPSEGTPENALRTIITHWTAITGHDVKSRKVVAA